jgi:hypothetical protein
MGRQCGTTWLLGTCGGVTGYADVGFDGEVHGYARMRSTLSRKDWKLKAAFAGSRRAAGQFGIASGYAGRIWSALPAGMRRIADGGAFNTLVGEIRGMVDEGDGCVFDWERLHGVNLGEYSQYAIRGLGLGVFEGSVQAHSSGLGLGGLQVDGLEGVFEMLGTSRASSEKHVMASRIIDGHRLCMGLPFAPLPWKSEVKSEQRKVKSGDLEAWGLGLPKSRDRQLRAVDGAAAPFDRLRAGSGRALPLQQRRFRVWVHAVEVVEMVWDDVAGEWRMPAGVKGRSVGYVTPWRSIDLGHGKDGLDGLPLELGSLGKDLGLDGECPWVVFAGVEVSEKRGRHWVRLPYCCGLWVASVENCDLREESVEEEVRWKRALRECDRGPVRARGCGNRSKILQCFVVFQGRAEVAVIARSP